MLYVEGFGRRIQATELSEDSAAGGWMVGGSSSENLALDTVWHESLENAIATATATATATAVALDSSAAAAEHTTATANAIGNEIEIGRDALVLAGNLSETLGHATLPASESDTIGRIVVFSDADGTTTTAGLPSVETCAGALGLKAFLGSVDLRATATVVARDWSDDLGFCCEDGDEPDQDDYTRDSDNDRKISNATRLMKSELTDHFEFNMSDEIVCAPVLYGGRSGSVFVAVLSMRVWT